MEFDDSGFEVWVWLMNKRIGTELWRKRSLIKWESESSTDEEKWDNEDYLKSVESERGVYTRVYWNR